VYERFQLIFHRISLSVLLKRPDYKSLLYLLTRLGDLPAS
jgi:hypothetical protein